MIVEFVGASGAGKSTLLRAVRDRLPSSTTTWRELVVDRPGRRWATHPSAVNLVADAAAVAPFVTTLPATREFVRFSVGRLRRHAPSGVAAVNHFRNVVRRVGVHELARRAGDRIVLVDEGAVLVAYHLLVYSRVPPKPAEIERFAALVPRPDVLVHVRAPTSELVARARSRPDGRRELRGTDADVHAALRRAVDVFDALASSRALRDRTIVVDNPGGPSGRLDAAADDIAAALRNRR